MMQSKRISRQTEPVRYGNYNYLSGSRHANTTRLFRGTSSYNAVACIFMVYNC